MTDLNILTICGSLRADSLNRSLANTLPELAPEGMSFTDAPSFADVPIYNFDMQSEGGAPPAIKAIGSAIRGADGVVIVSPEYNYSIPGGLKNAIDWLSRLEDQPFVGKPVAIQSAAPGMLGGARMQYHLRQTMVFLDARVLNKPEVFVGQGKQKISDGRLTDTASRDVVASQLAAFASFISTGG
jgi:chromate reductase